MNRTERRRLSRLSMRRRLRFLPSFWHTTPVVKHEDLIKVMQVAFSECKRAT